MSLKDKYFEKSYILFFTPWMVGGVLLLLTFVIPFLSPYFMLIATLTLVVQLLWWWFDIIFSLLVGRTGNISWGWRRKHNVAYRNQKYEHDSFWIIIIGKFGLTAVLTVFYSAIYLVATNQTWQSFLGLN